MVHFTHCSKYFNRTFDVTRNPDCTCVDGKSHGVVLRADTKYTSTHPTSHEIMDCDSLVSGLQMMPAVLPYVRYL